MNISTQMTQSNRKHSPILSSSFDRIRNHSPAIFNSFLGVRAKSPAVTTLERQSEAGSMLEKVEIDSPGAGCRKFKSDIVSLLSTGLSIYIRTGRNRARVGRTRARS